MAEERSVGGMLLKYGLAVPWHFGVAIVVFILLVSLFGVFNSGHVVILWPKIREVHVQSGYRLPFHIGPDQCRSPFEPSLLQEYQREWMRWRGVYLSQYAKVVANMSLANHNESRTVSKLGCLNSTYLNFWSGVYVSKKLRTKYVRIWKGANHAIWDNVHSISQMMNRLTFDQSYNNATIGHLQRFCTFTFLREPVARFIAGYNEMEWRITNSQTSVLQKCPGCTFTTFPLGSQERVWAFIADLLTLELLTSNGAVCGALRGAAHVFPMSGVLRHIKHLDFIGHLENIASDWLLLQEKCFHLPTTLIQEFNGTYGNHASSSDPYGTYKAAKELVASVAIVREAIEFLVATDYHCFPTERLHPE